MKIKDFQTRVLDSLNEYLNALVPEAEKSRRQAKLAAENPDAGIQVSDFTAVAWEALRTDGKLPSARHDTPFSPRTDGIGRPVPNVCLKVPTGGGKTLLAASSVSRILDKWLGKRTGMVLWICPNEAIFSQTRKALRDREHPYRHILDQASAGRTRILEKDDPLSRADVEGNLCVMLLMLQSANRETKESLRLFRDRGNVHGFFPSADDHQGHADWLQGVPNLDYYSDVTLQWHVVKDSLGNALRAIRPIVVVDEGHKGYSKLAMDTLYGFNPSFVLELSATPADRPKDHVYSNWLCDIRGTDLDKEFMVKLPINVEVKGGTDWRACLRESVAQLDRLQADAERLHSECARYVRPICLVQVERTGKEQRDGKRVHSQDALEYLLSLGLREEQVAIKSAEQDDLKAPERQDLLSPTNQVRVIITRSALQEGWDCPFAYVLCSLAPVTSQGAITQLIGRILRQPDTEKTGLASLDECYVYCLHSKTKDVIEAIKNGLERDGMGDLTTMIKQSGAGEGGSSEATTLKRRKGRESLRIFLPLVHWTENGAARPLDFETDLLSRTEPLDIDMQPLALRLKAGGEEAGGQKLRIAFGGPDKLVRIEERLFDNTPPGFDPVHVCRAVSDLVPNAWQARTLVASLVHELEAVGVDVSRLGERAGFLIDEMRKHLTTQLDEMAEALFRQDVAAGRIQFSLRTDGKNYRVPESFEAVLASPRRPLVRDDGMPAERSLFIPATEDGLNGLERDVACYVDGKEATHWWFRNVARNQYGLQGWRKHKVYPDLIASVHLESGIERLLVLETKGDHLKNEDTDYKKALLEMLTDAYGGVQKIGEMELELDGEQHLHCELVMADDWRTRLAALSDQAG